MRRIVCALGILLASCASVPLATPAAAVAPPNVEAEAVTVVEQFHKALAEGRRADVLALLAENVVILEGGHAERSRAEYEASHLGSDIEFSAATQRHLLKRVAFLNSSNAAVVVSEAHVAGKFRGRDINEMVGETIALHRFAEGWKIVHIHWSSAASD